MNKDEGVAPFFTKIAQVKDQLTAIGIIVDDDDLVQTMFDGLPNSQETFLAAVSGRENQPNFDRLWHDCLEEEGRVQNKTTGTKEGNLALIAKTRKFMKPSPQKRKGKKPQGKLPNASKLECYNCHKIGHFAKDCRQPKRKFKRRFQASIAEEQETKKKKNTKATKEDEPRREYYLIFALSGSITGSANSWLVDSGASKRMTGFREALTSYRKKFTTQVELGDDTTYKIEGVGSTSLQLE